MNESAAPAKNGRGSRRLRLAGDIHVEQVPSESPASAESTPDSPHFRLAGDIHVEEVSDEGAAPAPHPPAGAIRGRFFQAAEKRFFHLKGEINVVHLIVALLALWVAFKNLNNSIERTQREVNQRIQSAQQQVSGQVEKVETEVLAQKFVITFPSEGSSVHGAGLVRGRSPFLDRNTYVFVTPVKTGVPFVQDGPVKVNQGGLWTAEVQFGNGQLGVGEEFTIRALSTKSILPAGELPAYPADAVFSDAVTVIRR